MSTENKNKINYSYTSEESKVDIDFQDRLSVVAK